MPHVHTKSRLLHRRHVLRGVGATLALPLLDCMRAPRAAPPAPVGRAVFVYVPNGMNMPTWQPVEQGRDAAFGPSLAPLAAHRGDVTLISGLFHPGGIGQAHACESIWLTGAPLERGGAAFENTVSVDQCIAEHVGVHTRFPSLELALSGGTLAWSRSGVPLPALRSPRAVFERLFAVDEGGVASSRRRLRSRASVLDVVLGEARALERRIGSDDRTKLDEYLTAVREVELRTERAEGWLDVPRPRVDPGVGERMRRDADALPAGELYDALFELVALALRTDTTRVVTCMLGSEQRSLPLPEVGVRQARHELSHHGGQPEPMARLAAADTFLCARFAAFLTRLAEVEEGDERLLDRCAVLYGSGMSYGHSHGNANLPTLVAGGRALGLTHAGHVDFNLPTLGAYDLADLKSYYRCCLSPVDGNARLSNLHLRLLRCFDPSATSFADSTGPTPALG